MSHPAVSSVTTSIILISKDQSQHFIPGNSHLWPSRGALNIISRKYTDKFKTGLTEGVSCQLGKLNKTWQKVRDTAKKIIKLHMLYLLVQIYSFKWAFIISTIWIIIFSQNISKNHAIVPMYQQCLYKPKKMNNSTLDNNRAIFNYKHVKCLRY